MRYILSTLLVLLATVSFAQQVIRGPYLQSPTDSSIVIMWRTDSATTSKVQFGDCPTNLTEIVTDGASVTDHEIKLSGLNPYTKYFYSVGFDAVVLSGGNKQHHFTTHPTPGEVKPVRIWAIGDFGKGSQNQRDVWQAYMGYTDRETDVWLWLGDHAYNDGTDQEYQDKVFSSYYGYDSIFKFMPFYPTAGNHDYNSVSFGRTDPPAQHTGPYYDIVNVPTNGEAGGLASGYELYYSFDYSNIHFITINTELWSTTASYDWVGALSSGAFAGSEMSDWLVQDLQQNDKEWVVVYMHQPPYSKGSHDSDGLIELVMKAVRENYLPILDSFNVDLVIGGHSHVYERSYLIKGHYDVSSTLAPSMLIDSSSGNPNLGEEYVKYLHPDSSKGTVYVVAGNSGSSTTSPDLNHPAMYFSDGGNDIYGSLIIDINGNRLEGKYLRSNGSVLDEFAIVKPDGSAPDTSSRETDCTVGIFESSAHQGKGYLTVYPNPFNKEIIIDITIPTKGMTEVDLYSIDGKHIQNVYEGILNPGNYRYKVDAKQNVKPGVYFIRVKTDDAEYTQKIIKID